MHKNADYLIEEAKEKGAGIIILRSDDTEVRYYFLEPGSFVEIDGLTGEQRIVDEGVIRDRLNGKSLAQNTYDILVR